MTTSATPASFLADPPLDEAVQQLYDRDLEGLGYVMNLSKVWAQSPDALTMMSDAMRMASDLSDLDADERALLVVATASTMGDAYCSLSFGAKLARVELDRERHEDLPLLRLEEVVVPRERDLRRRGLRGRRLLAVGLARILGRYDEVRPRRRALHHLVGDLGERRRFEALRGGQPLGGFLVLVVLALGTVVLPRLREHGNGSGCGERDRERRQDHGGPGGGTKHENP